MATPIYLRSSAVATKVPTTSTLALRELGANTTDGKLYLRQGTGLVSDIIIPINIWNASTGGTTAYNTYFTAGNVGIGKTNPAYNLDVSGTAAFTTISAGQTTGNTGQYLQSTGTGLTWTTISSSFFSKGVVYQTATAGQTTFSVSYTINDIDIFLNGVKLQSSDYTASDGATVVLNTACVAGDNLEFNTFNSPITSTFSFGTVFDTIGYTTTTTSTSQTSIISLSSTIYRAVEYTIQVTQGTNYKISTVVLIHDGTTPTISEQNIISIGVDPASYDASISGGNILLLATPTSATSTKFRVAVNAFKI